MESHRVILPTMPLELRPCPKKSTLSAESHITLNLAELKAALIQILSISQDLPAPNEQVDIIFLHSEQLHWRRREYVSSDIVPWSEVCDLVRETLTTEQTSLKLKIDTIHVLKLTDTTATKKLPLKTDKENRLVKIFSNSTCIGHLEYSPSDTNAAFLEYVRLIQKSPKYASSPPSVKLESYLVFSCNESRKVSLHLDLRVRWASRDSVDKILDPWEVLFMEYALSNYNPRRAVKHCPQDILAAARGNCPFDTTSVQTSDFYDASHVPEKHVLHEDEAHFTNLKQPTSLFPFQRRTVNWMLNREGVSFQGGNLSEPLHDHDWVSRFMGEPLIDYDGTPFFANEYLGFVCIGSNVEQVYKHRMSLQGGILAEEMGLGKTVELTTLISLHKRIIRPNETQINNCKVSGATLIVMPLAIMDQWKNELSIHSPNLNVFEYSGTTKLRQLIASDKGKTKFDLNDIGDAQLVDYLMQFDVVLVGYPVLAQEIHYANKPPEREMRSKNKKYQRVSCPLMQINWWRVCLDEAQMVESGVSNAAKVARQIPRVNAWAISGTPVSGSRGIDDLLGLLIFLLLDPWASRKVFWNLLKTRPRWFRSLFGTLALRHTKDLVRKEISLPPQNRITVSIPLEPVDYENYQALYEDMCADCKVDINGRNIGDVPLGSAEEAEQHQKFRKYLVQLRQACIHPQIGVRNRQALGGEGRRFLKSACEVLDLMYEKNSASIRQDHRAILVSVATRAQLTMEYSCDVNKALEILKKSLPEVQKAVAELRAEMTTSANDDAESRQGINNAKYSDDAKDDQDAALDDDKEEDENSLIQLRKITGFKSRLNDLLEVEHMFYFLLGNAYHNLADEARQSPETEDQANPFDDEEIAYFERAKLVRRELMADTKESVLRALEAIRSNAEKQNFAVIPEVEWKFKIMGGIESNTIIENLSMIGSRLNEQANLLDDWRETLITLLQEPLIDSEDSNEAKGDEFEEAAKKQEEAFHYVDMVRILLADRIAMVLGVYSGLAKGELELITTKAQLGVSQSGEKVGETAFLRKLLQERHQVSPAVDEKPLRLVLADMKTLANRFAAAEKDTPRIQNEQAITSSLVASIQKIMTQQEKVLKQLQKEISLFSSVLNLRIEFYRKVQQISDGLQQYDAEAPKWKTLFRPDLPRDPAVWLTKLAQEEDKTNIKLAKNIAKGRYLKHLMNSSSSADINELCIICQDPIEEGYVTTCGHIFCVECLNLWRREKGNCPVCKQKLRIYDLYKVTYKLDDIKVKYHSKTKSTLPTDGSAQIYKGLDSNVFYRIKEVPLTKSFSSKIDAIIKHLKFIRQSDPNAKSVIFSQWKDALDVFQEALGQNGIGFASLHGKHGSDALKRFKHEPTVEVFLLHAKSQSAGLTLVNASHLFLLEPLVNTGLELQVIARIHRIGQTRETGVYMYTMAGTVEESVAALSTQRRLAMMKGAEKENVSSDEFESMLDAAASKDMEESVISGMVDKIPGGGEIVHADDLRECLFGNKLKRVHEEDPDNAGEGPSTKRPNI